MTTLIQGYGALGSRRCDAKCYAAEPGSDCDCICDGANHGRGMDKAIRITRRISGEGLRVFPRPIQRVFAFIMEGPKK